MERCSVCKRKMIRVGLYEPEGAIPLKVHQDKDGEGWVCINPSCPESLEEKK